MNYLIRRAEIEDMNAVMDAHRRSIQQICSQDYNEDQVAKWSNVKYSSDIWNNSVSNEFHLVVEVDGVIEGLCHAKIDKLQEGHIVGLYFTKKIAGKGIGREVFQRAIDYIKSHNASRVFINATITAKGFYEKMGFEVLEQTKMDVRGTTLDCFKMEKKFKN